MDRARSRIFTLCSFSSRLAFPRVCHSLHHHYHHPLHPLLHPHLHHRCLAWLLALHFS